MEIFQKKKKPHNTSSNQKQLQFETFHEVPSKLDLEFTIITIGKKSSKCAKCKPTTIQIWKVLWNSPKWTHNSQPYHLVTTISQDVETTFKPWKWDLIKFPYFADTYLWKRG